jgi:hypothetical protein
MANISNHYVLYIIPNIFRGLRPIACLVCGEQTKANHKHEIISYEFNTDCLGNTTAKRPYFVLDFLKKETIKLYRKYILQLVTVLLFTARQ